MGVARRAQATPRVVRVRTGQPTRKAGPYSCSPFSSSCCCSSFFSAGSASAVAAAAGS